jgi:endonuclease-3
MANRKRLDAQRFLVEVHRRLHEAFGGPPRGVEPPPTDELIATILSQHTSDTNSQRAFDSLKRKFASWEQVLEAPDSAVIDAIRSAGLANVKGPRIKRALGAVKEGYGTLDLEFMRRMPVSEVIERLTALPGVGPKTAACVALFSLEMPAFPVDTHVQRIGIRLGLLGPKERPERFQALVEDSMPEDTLLTFHLNLVRHGREVCRARSPLCSECTLLSICQFGARQHTAAAVA